jgi:hypothetical protein
VAPSLKNGLRHLVRRAAPGDAPRLSDDVRLAMIADTLFDAVFVHVDGWIV